MNKWKLIVGISLIVVTVFLIALDFFAISKGGAESTISRIIQSVSSIGQHFTIPFAWGVLTAHLFIYRKNVQEGIMKIISVSLLGGITLIVIILDLINSFSESPNLVSAFLGANVFIPLLVGGFLGWLLVPQKKRL